ncbi:hypothetical protein CQ011_15090 [Arthrobacter sp. MYb213]|nr:hypothetical protein CQ011_15090 [Arthrobacter sp. MYb213]
MGSGALPEVSGSAKVPPRAAAGSVSVRDLALGPGEASAHDYPPEFGSFISMQSIKVSQLTVVDPYYSPDRLRPVGP